VPWPARLIRHRKELHVSGYCLIAPGHPVHGHYHDHEYGFPQREERSCSSA